MITGTIKPPKIKVTLEMTLKNNKTGHYSNNNNNKNIKNTNNTHHNSNNTLTTEALKINLGSPSAGNRAISERGSPRALLRPPQDTTRLLIRLS